MNPRTGLGRFRKFRNSKHDYGVGGHEAAGTC
jgi:hypothetical protein